MSELHHLQVEHELFASPFNCYNGNYCSAFSEVDCAFNSSGPFSLYTPRHGSFEANPPFTEEVMHAMGQRLDTLLQDSDGPMSVAVVVPDRSESAAVNALVSMHALASCDCGHSHVVFYCRNHHVFIAELSL